MFTAKRLGSTVLRVLAAGFLLLPTAARPQSVSMQSVPIERVRGITVTGEGVVPAKPSLARVGLGIQVLAPTVSQAVKESSARMEELLGKLKSLGIPQSDILPSGYHVFPQRSFQGGIPGGISSYEVNNQLQVTVRDLGRLGAILDQAFLAGANQMHGITFSLEDTAALRSQARLRAVADARAKADELAGLGGVRRGDLLAISEVNVPLYPPFAALSSLQGLNGAAPNQPGLIEIRVQVQATFALAE